MYQRKHSGSIQSSNAGHLWPVPNSTARSSKRLKVLILGHDDHQDHFVQILGANVQQWGYEARILRTSALVREGNDEVEGDVLVYDLDVPLHLSPGSASDMARAASFAAPYLASSDEGRPRVRLMIALSSRSVSRLALEQIGAVAVLYKPFQMEQLQHYLQVFQQLLLEEPQSSSSDASSRLPVTSMVRGKGAHRGAEHSARILVVEDHPHVAEAIRHCLELEPRYDIRIAEDGLNALEQYAAWQPHCIVTDLLLPYMDGYQVMRTLSAASTRQMPAFVVISALTQHELPENHVYPHGKSVVFIDKPFQIENLLDAVEQALA